MRTVHYYTGQPDPIKEVFTDEVKISENRKANVKVCYDTPHGRCM